MFENNIQNNNEDIFPNTVIIFNEIDDDFIANRIKTSPNFPSDLKSPEAQNILDRMNRRLNKIKDDKKEKNEINLTNDYYEIYSYLNKKLLPPKWKIFKTTNKDITIEQWKKQIKKAFEDINLWIKEGCLNLYDVSLLTDKNIFFDNLPMYFLRKNPTESKITPDKVIIKYSISKYNEEDLKNEEIINQIKEEEKECIYITGIKIPGFDCEKLEEKNDVIFTENDFDKNGSLLPVIEVSYTIEEEKEEKKENEEEEEEDEEEEEESNNNQEEDNKNQNAEVI